MDLHIDDFYKDAAKGLLLLYQAFPNKSTLYMDDLIGYTTLMSSVCPAIASNAA